MKHKGLIITIVICLILFFVSLSAGIVLTVRTVGWSDLMDSTRLQERLENLAGSFRLPIFGWDKRQSYNIDDLKTADLDGIKTIKISGMSEPITLTAAGTQVEARLIGNYHSFGSQISWLVERQGDLLLIHSEYPQLGLFDNDLAIQVQIPADYSGEVQVSTLSGNCSLPGDTKRSWSNLKYSGMSGNLNIEQAEIPEISFSSMSGDIDILRCNAKISGDSVSGDVKIQWTNFAESSIKTISGDVKLILPENTACQISFTTVSGDLNNQSLPIQITEQTRRKTIGSINQGNTPLSVNTVSGNLIMSKP